MSLLKKIIYPVLLLTLLTTTNVSFSATFTVDSISDQSDSSPGNGICDQGSGFCTLRAAIEETNALAGSDTIEFSISGTIILASALPTVTQALTIIGPSANQLIVSGNSVVRVFIIDSPDVVISNISIRDGLVGTESPSGGAGIHVTSNAILELNDIVVSNNTAIGGGGIRNYGTLTLNNCTVIGNTATASSTYTFIWGGGIFNQGGTLIINNSTISGNSTIASGTQQSYSTGSGIASLGNSASVSINNSTISGNSGTVITSGSSSSLANGGGLYIYAGSSLTMNNSTVTNNTITNNDAGGEEGAGIYCCSGGNLTLSNSIVAGNTNTAGSSNCFYYNAIRNTQHNIEDADTCQLTGTGDQINTDPFLDILADNGGTTQTHNIVSGSPAIDAADNATCLSTDQRGVPRPLDGDGVGDAVCDVGAVEFSSSAIINFEPSVISFDSTDINSAPANQILTIRNNGMGALTVTSLTLQGAHASEFSVDPGDGSNNSCGSVPFNLSFLSSCAVTTGFVPTAIGLRDAQLVVESNAGTESVALTGRGIRPGIKVLTTRVDFGTHSVDSVKDETIYIVNEGGIILSIGSIGVNDPLESPFSIAGDGCSGSSLQPGDFCAVDVRFDPATATRFVLAGFSVSGLFLIGMLGAKQSHKTYWMMLYLVTMAIAVQLLSCSSGSNSNKTEYSDSFDIPSSDPDTSIVTVIVKGAINK